MDRGAWQATVHRVTESDRTERLSLLLSRGKTLFKNLFFNVRTNMVQVMALI